MTIVGALPGRVHGTGDLVEVVTDPREVVDRVLVDLAGRAGFLLPRATRRRWAEKVSPVTWALARIMASSPAVRRRERVRSR